LGVLLHLSDRVNEENITGTIYLQHQENYKCFSGDLKGFKKHEKATKYKKGLKAEKHSGLFYAGSVCLKKLLLAYLSVHVIF
jgi:hypothetical protein